jgi:hypothetical protein
MHLRDFGVPDFFLILNSVLEFETLFLVRLEI